MSSFRDKFKSKIKSKQEQPETMQSFDENALNVTITQAKTQLIELKVTCQWVNKTTTIPPPRLHCKWYNRTEHNIQQIIGIEGEIYQPSIIDVGSIIEITCIPQLPGVPYEGMPIMLKTNPICLSAETEAEATELLNSGRAKFLIDIKERKLKHRYVPNNSEGMIKIDGNKISICHIKFGQLNDEVIKEGIFDENYPQFLTGRKNSRELTLKLNEEEHLVIFFKGNRVRDTFSLLVKLIMMRISMDKMKPHIQLEEEKVLIVSSPAEQKKEEIVEQKQKSSNSLDILPKQQLTIQKDEIKQNPPTTKQIPSIQQSPTKQSTSQLLQLMNLRQEMKRVEIQNIKITKQLQNEREKVYSLECKIAESKERLENVSRNYFNLEGQLNLAKQQKISLLKKIQDLKKGEKNRQEETLYYKNEINLLNEERNQLKNLLQEQSAKQHLITQELNKFQKEYNATDNRKSYQELQQELANALEISNQLKMKYEYSMEEKDRIEETLKNSRNLIQQIESEKKYIEKKYQSLTNQLSSPSMMMKSRISDKSPESSVLSNSMVFQDIPSLTTIERRDSNLTIFNFDTDQRQKEILDLKKQLKDVIEQNNYVRGLLAKEKKPSSKTQLKLQLFEVKKLVNRLSEALMEKDMCIGNLKDINKELNKKNNQIQAQYQQLQRKRE